MRTISLIRHGALAAALLLVPAFAACDRTVSETTKTTQTPGGTKVEEQKVIQRDDGTVTKEKETHTVNNP